MINNHQQDIFSVLNNLKNTDEKQKKQTAEKMMSSMNEEDQKNFQSVIRDKNKVNEILNSPAVQQIMQKLNGQHK